MKGRNLMRNIEVKIKNEICEKLGITIAQMSLRIDEENDVHFHGSVSWGEARGIIIGVKASLCDAGGNILYSINNFSNILLDVCGYNTFSIYCSDVSRFIEVEKLRYIELFPYVKVQE